MIWRLSSPTRNKRETSKEVLSCMKLTHNLALTTAWLVLSHRSGRLAA